MGRAGRFRPFIASLWLALATALFCAVMPAGLPDSAKYGSAFNPANNAVSLQVPSSGNRAVLRRAAEGDPALGVDLLAPLPAAAVPAPIAVASLPAHPAPISFALSPIPEALYARGPPTA